jgi:hypothetical protein
VSEYTGLNPAEKTIAASGGVAPVLGIACFCARNNGSTISPRTTSITPDHELNDTGGQDVETAFYVHDYIQESSPADYTFDMDDEGTNNCLFGFYFHNFSG